MKKYIRHYFLIYNNKIIYNSSEPSKVLKKFEEYSKTNPGKYSLQSLLIPFQSLKFILKNKNFEIEEKKEN